MSDLTKKQEIRDADPVMKNLRELMSAGYTSGARDVTLGFEDRGKYRDLVTHIQDNYATPDHNKGEPILDVTSYAFAGMRLILKMK